MAKMLQQAFTNTLGTNEKIESLNKDREGFSKQRENTRPTHTDASGLTNAVSEKNVKLEMGSTAEWRNDKTICDKKIKLWKFLSMTGRLSKPVKKESLSHINSGRKKKVLTSLLKLIRRFHTNSSKLFCRYSPDYPEMRSCTCAQPLRSCPTLRLQARRSFTTSRSLSIEPVMPSDQLILCRPLLLPPPVFPSSRGFSESVPHVRRPQYSSFSFSISPSSEYSGLSSGMDC